MPCETARPRVRTLSERLVWLLIGLFIVRTWILDGFPVPCQVNGGSMAETLLGAHYEIVCADCGYSFVCEAGAPLERYQAICPNCGCTIRSPEPPPELAGDRVLIDKSAFPLPAATTMGGGCFSAARSGRHAGRETSGRVAGRIDPDSRRRRVRRRADPAKDTPTATWPAVADPRRRFSPNRPGCTASLAQPGQGWPVELLDRRPPHACRIDRPGAGRWAADRLARLYAYTSPRSARQNHLRPGNRLVHLQPRATAA